MSKWQSTFSSREDEGKSSVCIYFTVVSDSEMEELMIPLFPLSFISLYPLRLMHFFLYAMAYAIHWMFNMFEHSALTSG